MIVTQYRRKTFLKRDEGELKRAFLAQVRSLLRREPMHRPPTRVAPHDMPLPVTPRSMRVQVTAGRNLVPRASRLMF